MPPRPATRHCCGIDTNSAARHPWSPRSHPVAAAWILLAIALLGASVTLALLPSLDSAPSEDVAEFTTSLAYVLPYAVVGAFLVTRRPDLPFGWLLAGCAAVVAVGVAVASISDAVRGSGADSSTLRVGTSMAAVQFLPVAVQGLVNVRFPTGRITSRFGRVLDRLLIAGIAVGLVGGLLRHWSVASALLVAIPLVILLGIVAGLRIVRMALRANGIERDQLRWRALGVVLALALFPLAVTETLPLAVSLADGLLFTSTLVIPILRYRLWAIDSIIRRSAAYLLVTVLVAGLFAALAAALAAFQGERFGLVVAAVVTALVFGPALRRSQHLVDQLFYGRRGDPQLALRDLSRRLDAVAEPGEVLQTVVTTVAESLRLPYVAIERPRDDSVMAQHGERPANEALLGHWQLTSQGMTVGTLVAAPRRGESVLAAPDREVLTDLARQAGAAVHAEALTAELVASRQHLVEAREEERRRLRRELHDGLGPLLTSVGLHLDALRTRLPVEMADRSDASAESGGDPSLALLAHAKAASGQAISNLRTVVYSLRPPALDDLGVVGAVGAHVRRMEDVSTIDFQVDGADVSVLQGLPAAVEVAMFRIAVEAVTNVVRHSDASRCRIGLGANGADAVVEVDDDGADSSPWSPGVGIVAMRERVAELGGTFEAGPGPHGGRLRATFPLTGPGPAKVAP